MCSTKTLSRMSNMLHWLFICGDTTECTKEWNEKYCMGTITSLCLCNWSLCFGCVSSLIHDVPRRAVSSLTLTPTAIGLEPTTSSCLLIALIVPAWPTIREMDPCVWMTTRVRHPHTPCNITHWGIRSHFTHAQTDVQTLFHRPDNVRFCFIGGAPNYFPNSFSAPDCQTRFMESKFRVSPDVARYNSSDEDNVTQV